MRLHSLSSIAASLLLVGCVGEYQPSDGSGGGGGGGGDGATARELYDDLNEQQIAECGACHVGANLDDTTTGPDYLGPNKDASYETILAYKSWVDGSPIIGNSPENSKLLLHGVHAGPALSESLKSKMSEWIAAQAVEDGVAPPDDEGDIDPPDPDEPPVNEPPDTLIEALTLFANCMTYTDFEATNFENVADQNTAEGQCYACHSAGTGGSFLSANNIDFYTQQRNMPYILKFVTGTVNTDGSFSDLIISGRYELKRDDNGHPNYIMAEERLQSIQNFFDLTYAKYSNAIATGVACTPDAPVEGQ
jgi:mono/diheme cytochrome c family protein